MSNTWVTCSVLWDKPWKRGLILDIDFTSHGVLLKDLLVLDGLAAYQLVGEVMAHQGIDG